MWFVLLLSLSLVSPVQAAPSELGGIPDVPLTESLVADWTAEQYNQHLIAEDYEAVLDLYLSLSDSLRDPNNPSQQRFLDALQKMLDEGRARTVAAPAYREDGALRDAVVDSYDVMLSELQRTRSDFLPLLTAVPLTNEHIAQLETATLASEVVNTQRSADLRQAQVDFATRHGAEMGPASESTGTLLGLKAFTATGLPPQDSALPADIWVVMATGYLQGCIQIHNSVVTQQMGIVQAAQQTGPGAEEARLAGLAELEAVALAIDVMGDFHGDNTLLLALKAEQNVAVSLFENEMAALAKVQANGGPVTDQDVKDYNGAMIRLNDELAPLTAGMPLVQQAFQNRWQFAAYEAFRVARTKEIDAKAASLAQ